MKGIIYILSQRYPRELGEAVAHMAHTVRLALLEVGDLQLHCALVESGKRRTNIRDMHEP